MKASALARLPFLHGVPPSAIAAVNRVLRPMSVTAGTMLFRTGDEGDACYLVEHGSLRVTAGPDGETLATLGPGAFVGELAILLGEPRSATVTAVTDTKLAILRRRDLNSLMAQHPAISVALSRELGRRIVHTNQRFAADRAARRSIVWPATQVAAVASGILRYDRRVAVAALGGAALGTLPDGAARAKAPHYGVGDNRLDAVLVGVDDAGSARAAAVVATAEHVLCFAEPPPWLQQVSPEHRIVRLTDDALGIRRAVRWATGRSVGLALSSGGSKAIAHMGVVRVLRAAGVEIDAVAGSSGGAIAAVGVAFDQTEAFGVHCIADLARATKLRRLDINLPPRSGLSKGRRLRDVFAKWDLGENLEGAAIPTWLVGSDVATGGTVVMHRGRVADAIRASLSVPGVFDPWPFGDKLVMDGAVANPLPTDVLRDAGVGIVIASNVAGQVTELAIDGRLPGLSQIVGRVLNTMERERIRSLLPLADVVVRPRVASGGTFDFSNVESVIDEGVTAANERLPDIRSLLAAASGRNIADVR